MSVDVLNETDIEVDEIELMACARYVMEQLRVHPRRTCASPWSTETAMESLHVKWMDLPGPTDVMSFPMDELRPGRPTRSPPKGCSATSSSARGRGAPGPGGRARGRGGLLLLTVHGLLHLLGYDHAEPVEDTEMFELQRRLLLTFLATRGRRGR